MHILRNKAGRALIALLCALCVSLPTGGLERHIMVYAQETRADQDGKTRIKEKKIAFDTSWEYGAFSKIHSGKSFLYYADETVARGITVCVNAGHGTRGGSSKKTQCHPDGSPKIVGGSTAAGETTSYAIVEGMTFPDGTMEAEATLSLAGILKDKLLAAGYNVLMIRRKDDVQLDNIARTVMANQNADCHIALHYDSTESDKGAFFMSVPDVKSYRNMEPVKSHWKEHHKLGTDVIKGLKAKKVSIYNEGEMAMDLTQTSYSTIPSIDLEVGDGGSDISEKTQKKIAAGILKGINMYYSEGEKNQDKKSSDKKRSDKKRSDKKSSNKKSSDK